MDKKLLEIKEIDFEIDDKENNSSIENISKKDIAVIGMSAKLAGNSDVNEFWDMLVNGKDCIRQFPEKRQLDVEDYLSSIGVKDFKVDYHMGGFMEEVDKFDSNFFSISPREASLMDPNQRLFLETVWNAIEDAGYGGKKLYGTKTGVFLGYSTDFGEEYKKIIQAMNPDAATIAVTGNIRSIISSRISYILNLLGPSIVIDTACSSGLVSVHTACRSIRNGECEVAIAGGVKVQVLPIKSSGQTKWGIQIVNDIESSSGKTKTFDDDSDGTVIGEGVAAVILKPLSMALEDRDNIYAVIKGSAINQDGSSIGITTPNSRAQEEVICAAWKDAGVNPGTISYIEAHGTGTKLGDSVEISGIQRAFRNYTDKKQFCSIGSVKTNIGHLDSTSGISGLIKAILSLQHKQLPPSIHFNRANKKIDFCESPIYVNDLLSDWKVCDMPRRCGVSSFGLSGTNCHMVLEEVTERKKEENIRAGLHVLALSARSREALVNLVGRYIDFTESKKLPSLSDICYTANTGRGHYNYRTAIIAGDLKELREKLVGIRDYGYGVVDGVFYGEHKVVSGQRKLKLSGEITEDEKRNISKEADSAVYELSSRVTRERLRDLCSLYIKGADVDWEALYENDILTRVSLPTYPFEKTRHWVEKSSKAGEEGIELHTPFGHPLVDVCLVKSMNLEIYMTRFNVDRHWVLNEHKVFDRYIVPGTTYIEIVREIFRSNYPRRVVELNKIVFISPLAVEEGETRETHIVCKNLGEYIEFTVASKDNHTDSWIVHMEGKAVLEENDVESVIDLDEIKHRFEAVPPMDYRPELMQSVKLGQRWNSYKKVYMKEGEYFAHIQLHDTYAGDISLYGLHPALMDCAINAANPTMENGFYLPLTYKRLRICGSIPQSFYSYLKRKGVQNPNGETAVFDVVFIDEQGRIFLEAEDYAIKRVREEEFKGSGSNHDSAYHQVCLVKQEIQARKQELKGDTVLIFMDTSGMAQELVQRIAAQGKEVIEVVPGNCFYKLGEKRYSIGCSQDDYKRLMGELGLERIPLVIHLSTLGSDPVIESLEQLEEAQNNGLYSLYYLINAMVGKKLADNSEIILISDYVSDVAETVGPIKPHNSSMAGLAKVVGMEYPKLKCRFIDIDRKTTADHFMEELMAENPPFMVAYREGERYVEEFRPLKINAYAENEDIKEGRAYLVTGGTGALGLEVCRFLASKKKVKIGLISRTGLPDRKQWDGITEEKLLSKINLIRLIESSGSEVVCYRANVGNYVDMEAALKDFKGRFGKIHGVIHCAGVAGNGYIFRKDESVFKSVITPKISGTWILDKLTQDDNPDFFVMFSSVASVIPIAGQSDYTAANCYMDAFAAHMVRSGRKAVAINWPPWKEVGMAVDYKLDMEKGSFKAVTKAEALVSLESIISSGVPRVIVGSLNYDYLDAIKDNYLIYDRLKLSFSQKKSSVQNDKISKYGYNVIIIGKDEAALTEIELNLARVWARTLHLDKVDIYDSFYNIGGDSLLATALVREIEKVYPDVIDVTDVFTYSTISEMSLYLEGKTKKKVQSNMPKEDLTLAKIVDLLSRNEITLEESDRIINELAQKEAWLHQ